MPDARQLFRRRQGLENAAGCRALEGHQAGLVAQVPDGDVHPVLVVQEEGQVLRRVGGVDDDQPRVGQVIDEDVVHDAAGLREDHAVVSPAGRQAREVPGLHPLEKLLGLRSGDFQPSHVVDVEEPRGLAHAQVLRPGTGRVLHRACPSRRSRPCGLRCPGATGGAWFPCRLPKKKERAFIPFFSVFQSPVPARSFLPESFSGRPAGRPFAPSAIPRTGILSRADLPAEQVRIFARAPRGRQAQRTGGHPLISQRDSGQSPHGDVSPDSPAVAEHWSGIVFFRRHSRDSP